MMNTEAVCVRNAKLFESVVTCGGPMQNKPGLFNISEDALLDSFLVIYDECCKDVIKKDINVSYFVKKYKCLASEIRQLRVSLSDFDLKSTIGSGHFGEVRLAQEKTTGDIYAIKIINKTKTLLSPSASLFEEERDILSMSKSAWLARLQYAFQDNQFLYLVMEYLPGGDLSSLVEREGGHLTVDQARFYLAETLTAIHELHRMGFVHRDVKPENLLLDRSGHIKLADFGSAARICNDGRVVTAMPAGTPDYIAPEVLKVLEGGGDKSYFYGTECDFWSLGVVAYKLVLGVTPFSSVRTSVTYSQIMTHTTVRYPDSISVTDSLKDLINNLLRAKDSRLDYHGARKHIFFFEIDFNHLREVVPPIVPVVKSPEDTSNFSRVSKKAAELTVTPRDSNKAFSGKQLPFIGYTYSGYDNQRGDQNKREVCTPRLSKQQDNLETVRKENQALLAKLLSAQQKSRGSDGARERADHERVQLQRELARERQISAALKKQIEQEHEDRHRDEQKALMIVKQAQQQHDRELMAITTEYQAKLETLNDSLTQTHTLNNELTSRCDRAEAQVKSLGAEVDQLKSLSKMYKDKVVKARESRRNSVCDMESRLDKIHIQGEKWREDFNGQVKLRQLALEDSLKAKSDLTRAEEIWEAERTRLESALKEARLLLMQNETELAALQKELSDTSKIDALTIRLSQEQVDSARLKAKIVSLENDLCNTTRSFLEHESEGQRSSFKELEDELKTVIEEKSQLQKSLQGMHEKENENKASLNELEKILETLEQEVKKLENENLELKRADPNTVKLTSEAETQYQLKIAGLEQQIKKLDGQLERRWNDATNVRQELRDTQTKLRKTEKDLADARLDVRIATREAKTAEESSSKLKEELKVVNERLKRVQEESNCAMTDVESKLEEVRNQLKSANDQIEELKVYKIEAAKLREAQQILRSDNEKLRNQLTVAERDLSYVKAQLEAEIVKTQALSNEKAEWSTTVEDSHRKIASLEVNNALLRETSAVLDEQLDDYEKIVADQNIHIDSLRKENAVLTQAVSKLEGELSDIRSEFATEKATHSEVRQQLELFKRQLADKTDLNDELRRQVEFAEEYRDTLSSRLVEKEKQIGALESELTKCDFEIRQCQSEVIWLREEISKKISDIYLLKENSESLHVELEERDMKMEALDERNQLLEKTVSDHELFHKQRELKDKEQIMQLNKVIKFLQAQIDEKKKKPTLTDKLFGRKRREPPSPQAPGNLSPRSPKSTSDQYRKKLHISPKSSLDSPRSSQALSQIVSSPTNRMQRQISLPRMHHRIPHRFQSQHLSTVSKCASCHNSVSRGSKASVCTQCAAVAHPNCAVTAPKTCGLPAGLAQHFVRSVETADQAAVTPTSVNSADQTKGWVSLMIPGESNWKRRYIQVDGSDVKMFDNEPTSGDEPCVVWSLVSSSGHAIISADVTTEELPMAAKSDLPYVIKIVRISQTTCWPAETYFMLTSNASEKTQWITVLQSAVSSASTFTLSNKMTRVLKDEAGLSINCVQDICSEASRITLLGTASGLFSVHSPGSVPVKISGVTSVHCIDVAIAINQAILVVGEHYTLATTDLRLLESNARSAACAKPEIVTEVVELDSNQDAIMMMKLSDEINGVVYLVVATENSLILCRWCCLTNKWLVLRSLPSLQGATSALFLNNALLVATQTFQFVSLKDFTVKEMFNTRVSQRLLRMRSYPMHAAQLSDKEVILCFREFGLFVDYSGEKTRPDLKWAHSPKSFGFSYPYLFVISSTSVEIVKLSSTPDAAATSEDTLSIATTATLVDTVNVPMDNPQFLGVTNNGGMYVSSGGDVWLIEGKRLCVDVGSCATLDRAPSESQFSFTSSLVGSLDGSEEDEYSSEDKMQHTEL